MCEQKATNEIHALGSRRKLENETDMALYLQVCLEEYSDDPGMLPVVLADVARAMGINEIAQQTGLPRKQICKAMKAEDKAGFAATKKAVRALILKLRGIHASAKVKATAKRKSPIQADGLPDQQ